MTSNTSRSGRSPTLRCAFVPWFLVALFAGAARLAISPALADGCFVFKWDKQIDINEPTQKAIILYDAGREDLLLQVKYEGPLQEFGWLVPVPAKPLVERGSMDAFYEISELTQRHLGGEGRSGLTQNLSAGADGTAQVNVIETKTVGAYEVAILSAKDATSLEEWLKANGYSIPEGKNEIVNDYIQRNWYFVAAKIQLNGSGFKLASETPRVTPTPPTATIQKQLASGELHPLLISFDTPHCVFPLRISSVAAHPSEVSLYVISETPLLNAFMFAEAKKRLEQQYAQWEHERETHIDRRVQAEENMRMLALSFQLKGPNTTSRNGTRGTNGQNWSADDLRAMARESRHPEAPPSIDYEFYASGDELVHCLHVETNQLAKTGKTLPRLKGKSWYVTKFSRVFAAEEMQDLEFQPARPILAEYLSQPAGEAAAITLAKMGPPGAATLSNVCKSPNLTARRNAAIGLEHCYDRSVVEPLIPLLSDATPQVRLHAARAAANNWDRRFAAPMRSLFRDSYQEIRGEAVACLERKERAEQTPIYLELANDEDPHVRLCSLSVLARSDPNSIPPAPIVQLLKDRDPGIQASGLHLLWRLQRNIVPRSDLLPFLSTTQIDNIAIAMRLIEGNGLIKPELPEDEAAAREQEERKRWLTSSEVAPLVTNRLSQVRIIGLKILERNADAHAVELTLPLLQDTNAIVRNRAFTVMKSITGRDLSDTDPAIWGSWWKSNRNSVFKKSASVN